MPEIAPAATTNVHHEPWGKTASGEPVEMYTLDSGTLRIGITTYGATIVTLFAPDRDGQHADVVLGHTSIAGYEADRKTYFGATIGRFANRIADGRFILDGTEFRIPQNNGENALHGGPEGFDRRAWAAQIIPNGVEMNWTAADGEMGFPGELKTAVRFTLIGHTLTLEYTATTTRTTVLNLTNHSYFNLAGESSGTILDHRIRIAADRYTPVNESLIPTGELATVEDSAFDFRKAASIGEHIEDTHPQLEVAGGYDHNFVISEAAAPEPRLIAEVSDPRSGRTMTVHSTEPGVQFYSGNFLDGTLSSKGGAKYVRRAGFCLETQHFPDSPNQPGFPSTRLNPAETFRSTTAFSFSAMR